MKRNAFNLLIFSIYIFIGGENIDSLFLEANTLYQKGDYNQAIKSYESLLEQDIDNSILYYNMANAYYNLDQLGHARLYYEKAKLYDFNDSDVNYNLNTLEQRLIDDVLVVPDFFLKAIFKKIAYYFTAFEWSLVILVSLYLSLCLFLILMFSSNIKTRANSLNGLFLTLIILIISSCFLFFVNSSNMQSYGVLILDNGYVKTAPSKASDNRFVIHEGIKFKLIDEVDNWSRIELLDGNDGWIENSHFSKVY
tara:strand:+ start:606 stop:1361 length:756 start_codon:yes stop_codon:yes gene_type:complete